MCGDCQCAVIKQSGVTYGTDMLIYYLLLVAVFIVQFSVLLYFTFWMRREFSDDIIRKYPRKIRFLSALPFPMDWQKHIASDDISIFFRYRETFLLLNIFVLVSLLFEVVVIMFIAFDMLLRST